MTIVKKGNVIPIALFTLVLPVLGIISVAFTTSPGVGISPDSTAYIDAATNLLNKRRLVIQSGVNEFTPLTHYPPLFPTLLAIIGSLGFDLLSGAKWLNILLFGGNIQLVGLIIYRCADKHAWPSMLGSYFVLTSTSLLHIHSMAWTEPLFIFSSLLALLSLSIYVETRKTRFLLISSAAASVGFLSRYVGVALIATGFIGLPLLSKRALSRRLLDGLVFTALSCVPMLLWLTKIFRITGNALNRQIAFHPITLSHAKGALSTLSAWLLPDSVPDVIGWIISPIIIAGLVVLLVRSRHRHGHVSAIESIKRHCAITPCLFFLFATVYAMTLFVSISLFDASTPLSTRILSPIYISGVILAMYTASDLLTETGSKPDTRQIRAICLALGFAFAVSYVFRATEWVAKARSSGLGYTNRAWQQSEAIHELEHFPADTLIYSNGPDAIRALNGRFAYRVPLRQDPISRTLNNDCLSELATMKKNLEDKGGIVVWFDAIDRHYLPSEQELRNALALELVSRQADGAIYQLPSRESQ